MPMLFSFFSQIAGLTKPVHNQEKTLHPGKKLATDQIHCPIDPL
jgi:hypothetical protein